MVRDITLTTTRLQLLHVTAVDSSNVVNELSDRKRARNESIQSEEGEKCYPLKRPKTADDKEVGEIRCQLYELALEVKSMNESTTDRKNG